MAITASDILTRFPEFSDFGLDKIDAALAEAERNTSRTQWGSKADDATAYLTAHLLTVYHAHGTIFCGFGDAPGPVTSESEDRISASYQVPMMFANDEYGKTKYGQRYLTLLNSIFVSRCI